MTTLFIIKFGSDRMKNREGIAFEIFAPMGSHVHENETKVVKTCVKSEHFEKRKKIVWK